ncbi:MAG: HigA family addiction module antidote protein [Betaproteobacteria bacterium]|nr:HigA family addiction module antidote protein [Betaproteobacteria bacterium]
MAKLTPIHPGEILDEEFLTPLGLSQYRLAVDMAVPPRRINEIVLGRRGITAGTALRLAHYFGNSAQFWMNLQTRYDLEVEQDRLQGALASAPRYKPAAQAASEARKRYRGRK